MCHIGLVGLVSGLREPVWVQVLYHKDKVLVLEDRDSVLLLLLAKVLEHSNLHHLILGYGHLQINPKFTRLASMNVVRSWYVRLND